MITLIPAIDIIGGHCIRLSQGDYSQKTDYGDSPAKMAARFEKLGYERLHVVDLDGARLGHPANLDTLKAIREATTMRIDFGGGIKSGEDLKAAFASGAEAVSIGSIAVNDFEKAAAWIEEYGAAHFIISADVRDGHVRTRGWTQDSGLSIDELLAEYWPLGVRRVLCTDISRDGMLCSPNVELYSDIMEKFPDCRLIASGGVGSEADIDALNEAGIPAVVFGRAIYEGKIDLQRLADKYGLTKKPTL